MQIRWARSAKKHGISARRSGHVVRTAEMIVREPAPSDSPLPDDRIVFLGPDPAGVPLEVIAIETDEGFIVIHAMKMRRKYQSELRKGRHA